MGRRRVSRKVPRPRIVGPLPPFSRRSTVPESEREEVGMPLLEGKIAIVTGGTSGIGAACVEKFVLEGARVVVAGRRHEEGRALERKFEDAVTFVRTDVSEER